MEKKQREKITALIPAGIEGDEDKIERALKSVLWADEIFVVLDSKSRDKTFEIARSYGARIEKHEYVYSAKQKNWAIPRASHDWIILVDSDEVVTPSLRKEIKSVLEGDETERYDGFGIARKHFFLGKFLRWGGRYPLYNIRMFKKTARYEDRDVHAHIILDKNRARNLKGDILHFSDPDLDHFFKKFNRYTSYQANYIKKIADDMPRIEVKKFFTNFLYFKSVVKDYWYFLPFTSWWRFLYMYVFRFGFLDGRHGFMIAFLYSFQDYAAKTKFLQMEGRTPRLRLVMQNILKGLFKGSRLNTPISDRINKEELSGARA